MTHTHKAAFNMGYFQRMWNHRLNALGWRYWCDHRLNHKGEDTLNWPEHEWRAYEAGIQAADVEVGFQQEGEPCNY